MAVVNITKKNKFSITLPSHIGHEMTAQINGKTYKTVFRGEKEGEYLIVDLPVGTKGYAVFLQGEQVIIRYMHKGVAYGFISYMLKKIVEPGPLLFLEYPQHIEETDIRKSERVEMFFPVRITTRDARKGKEGAGYMMNLSATGCKIFLKGGLNLNPGEDVLLSCTLPTSRAIKQLPCVIKNVGRRDKSTLVGVEFYNEDKNSLAEIETFLQSLTQVKEVSGE